MKPGVYPDMSMAQYLAIPAVSAGIIRRVVSECPRAGWFDSWLNGSTAADEEEVVEEPEGEADHSDAKDTGSIAHGVLLEHSMAGVVVIDPNDHPAKTTGNIPKGWGNNSIKAARDAVRAGGKIPVLPAKMHKIESAVSSAREFIESLQATQPAVWLAFQPDHGRSELTVVWDEGGTLCKLRADRTDLAHRLIVDAKFTAASVEPERWARTQLSTMGYDISAAFYRRGYRRAFNTEPSYSFLAVEMKPPYLCSMVGVDPHRFALADSDVEFGLRTWRKCVAENSWPGYPNDICYLDVPAYEETRRMERRGIACDEQGIPYDVSLLFERTDA